MEPGLGTVYLFTQASCRPGSQTGRVVRGRGGSSFPKTFTVTQPPEPASYVSDSPLNLFLTRRVQKRQWENSVVECKFCVYKFNSTGGHYPTMEILILHLVTNRLKSHVTVFRVKESPPAVRAKTSCSVFNTSMFNTGYSSTVSSNCILFKIIWCDQEIIIKIQNNVIEQKKPFRIA